MTMSKSGIVRTIHVGVVAILCIVWCVGVGVGVCLCVCVFSGCVYEDTEAVCVRQRVYHCSGQDDRRAGGPFLGCRWDSSSNPALCDRLTTLQLGRVFHRPVLM